MRLTARDQQILVALYLYRVLNGHQIEALFFPPVNGRRTRKTSRENRLKRMYHNQIIDRIMSPIDVDVARNSPISTDPMLYKLDLAGRQIVASLLEIDTPEPVKAKSLMMFHTLRINDFRVVVSCLVRDEVIELIDWQDEHFIKRAPEKAPTVVVRGKTVRRYPDGYFCIQAYDLPLAHFFFEVDMGKETGTVWKSKVRAYNRFRASGASQRHFGTKNFRVLTLTKDEKRLANLKKHTEEAGGGRHYWFTTFDRYDIWEPQTLLQPIWHVATDDQIQSLF